MADGALKSKQTLVSLEFQLVFILFMIYRSYSLGLH